jgi:hypothetical protein
MYSLTKFDLIDQSTCRGQFPIIDNIDWAIKIPFAPNFYISIAKLE